MDTRAISSPEERGRDRAEARARLDRRMARHRPLTFLLRVFKRTVIGTYNDGFIHAGNLAYLALMTLFPFFIVAAAVASLLGQGVETQRAVASFLHVLPRDVGDLLRQPIADVLAQRTGGLLWLGGLVGLWTVGGFIETLRDIFRRAYGVKATRPFWQYRLTSAAVIIGSVVVALTAFLVQGVLAAVETFIYRLLPFAHDLAAWIGLSRAIPGLVMFLSLYALFYWVTPSKYRYSECRKWPGALFTAGWWVLMTAALPPILTSLGGYGATYGSLAGVIVALSFFFLVGLGLVFGAHLNAALANPADVGLEAAEPSPEGAR